MARSPKRGILFSRFLAQMSAGTWGTIAEIRMLAPTFLHGARSNRVIAHFAPNLNFAPIFGYCGPISVGIGKRTPGGERACFSTLVRQFSELQLVSMGIFLFTHKIGAKKCIFWYFRQNPNFKGPYLSN